MIFDFLPESIAMMSGVVLSLVFSYIPGLAEWFNLQNGTSKRLIMLGLMLVVVVVAFGLVCASVIGGITCDKVGVVKVITGYILAMVANQSAYSISPNVGRKALKKT
jgi:MFS family permease